MTDAEKMELEGLQKMERGLRQSLSRVKARIAEIEGRPATARFDRMIAGDLDGGHSLYLEMRAEEYRLTGRIYELETPEDRAAIETLVGLRPATVVVEQPADARTEG